MPRKTLSLLIVVVLAPSVVAGEPPPPLVPAPNEIVREEDPAQAPTTLLAKLGRPARPEAVDELVADHRSAGLAERLRLAQALGDAGGPAAADGLAALASLADRPVRAAAFEAATRVGLRHEKLRGIALWGLGHRKAQDRASAVAALGAVGDGRDVALLLSMAEDERETAEVRLSAFGALRQVSGVRLPYRIERWRAWWTSLSRHGPGRLAAAVQMFEQDPEQREVAAGILARMAWLRLPAISKSVALWLRDGDAEIRTAAARIVGASRSAKLAGDLAEAWDAAKADSTFRVSAKHELARLGAESLLRRVEPDDRR